MAVDPAAAEPRGSLRDRWRRLAAQVLTFRPALPPRWPRLEGCGVALVFFVSALVQFNAVLHDGALGLGYPGFFDVSVALAEHPGDFAALAGQGAPLAYLVNAFFVWLTGNVHAQAVCGLFNLVINLGALWTFHRLAQRFIAGGVWRMTLLTLAAFLPLRLIHAVVLSSDALTLWPFFALAAVTAALSDPESTASRRLRLAFGAGGLLTLGTLTQHTFASALVAVFLIVLQMARRRVVRWGEAALLWAVMLGLPLAVLCVPGQLHTGSSSAVAAMEHPTGPMAWRDVLWFHGRDKLVFTAPAYNHPIRVSLGYPENPALPYELLQPHAYSYPALTHLGVFTDVFNIFQYDPTDAYFGERNERNQHLMAAAVKTAVPITLLCGGATVLLGLLSSVTGLWSPARSRPDLEAVSLLAFGWFGAVVVRLPLVTMPCEAGFWMPRLTMPALLLFLLLAVSVLERLLPGKPGRAAAWLALGYVAGQSALQVCFLWPWGRM